MPVRVMSDAAQRLVDEYGARGIELRFDLYNEHERTLGRLKITVGKGENAHVTHWGDDFLGVPEALAEATRECVRSWAVLLTRELRLTAEPTWFTRDTQKEVSDGHVAGSVASGVVSAEAALRRCSGGAG